MSKINSNNSYGYPGFPCPICNAKVTEIGINIRCPKCKNRFFFDKRWLDKAEKTKKENIKACA